MWKMYNRNAQSGSTKDFWEHVWDEASTFVTGTENDRVCENQGPLWRLMRERVSPDRLFLEAGCGPANWARYFHERGYQTLAVDFADRTVERVRKLAPQLDVRVGDVTNLPLPDGSVHSYYSGGVVEHFESGPEPALREARRVLAPDGWFFCSVPDSNVIRTQLSFRLNKPHPARKVWETRVEPVPDDLAFFQYTFTRQEFIERLEAAGFVVEQDFGFSLLWGLMEIPGMEWTVQTSRRLLNGRARHSTEVPVSTSGSNGHSIHTPVKSPARRAFERVLLQEDTSIPVVGPVVAKLREHCSNMRMYVARPRKRN
jgi:SAM-dependent methyltransferase